MSRQKNKTKSLKQNIIAIASTGLGSAGCVSLAFALPGGGTIVTGGISIGVAGNNMTITQADSKGIINWGVGGTQGAVGSSGFNINAGELVNFVQSAGPGAVTLNRDLSGALSNISGMLTANGNVFLVNPAGVVFGGGSTVNVGGLLATTANIADVDFLGTDGTAKFAFTGNHAGEIEAALGSSISAGKGGTNSAQSGTGAFVYLIAPTVETNGDIKTHVVTQIGQVTLAAADKFEVELSGSGLINFAINPSAVANANFKVDQKGSIETQQVLLTADQATSIQTSVVNNDGVIEATQLVDIAADTVIQNGAIAADVTVTPPVAPSTSPSYTVNTKTTAMKVKAGKSISTGAASKTAASTLTLQTTTKEAHIGGTFGVNNGDDTTPVTFDADTIHAVTNRGHIYLKDTAGGVTVGEVDTGITAPTSGDPVSFGTSVILNTVGGGIRGGKLDSSIPNFRRRANTFNLNADGDIGNSPTDLLGLDTTTLLASTRNGHIYVNNQGDLALGKLQITEPVVTINNGQPLVAFVGASDQGNGRVRIPDGSDAGRLGVKDIVVSAGGDIVLTNTISATRNLTLNSGKSVQAVPAGTQQPVNTLLTGVQVTVSADGSVGNVGQALKTNAENVSINANKGSVYINEQNGLSSISVTAQDDIYVSADSGNISLGALSTNKTLDSIKDFGAPTAVELEDVVSVIAKRGNIQSGVGSLITSEALELNAIDFIGTAASPIQFTGVERLLVINNGVNAGTFLAGNSASVKSIDATIKGGDFSLSESGVDALRYIALTETLNLNRLIAGPVRFINESTSIDRQDIKIAAGTGAGVGGLLTLKTEGSVSRASGVLTAGSINVTADKGIDLAVATGSAVLVTKFGDINLDTTSNSASTTLTLDAQTLAANKNITVKTTGGLFVQRAQSLGAVTLEASTHLADLVNAQISGLSLSAKAASVGSVSDAFDANIDGPISVTASSGGIYLSNTGNVGGTGFNAQATGDIDFKNNGDVAFGKVETTTGNINVAITGDGTDAHVNAPDLVNFSAVMGSNGLTYAAKSMGVVGNRLEINVSKLVVDTTSGGIYAINDNNTAFSLIRAKASGAEANIDIETKGDLALGTVESRGNNVKLTAASKITDARTQDQKNLKTPNVRSKSLDLKAGNGVDDLLLDVNFISAAGGAGEVKATNQGAVSLDRASLENKSVSIKATEIYVIDLDGTVNLAPAGTINLEATDGNIVFLDPTNTLVMGSGNITLTAKTGASVQGAGGVIIAGNLKTNGNINLSADSNITVNELSAGSGNVSVTSNKGIIIDGNGSAHNITGVNVSLSATTPTVQDAIIRRETAISEFSANQAEVGALTTLKKTSETTFESTKNSENTIKTTLSIAENNQRTTQNNFNSKNAQAEELGGELEDLQLALEAAGVAVDVLEIGVGAAQAVPFSGDAGATAAFAIVRLALSAASLAVTVFEREELAPVVEEVTKLRALLSSANSNVFSTKNLLAKATSDRQAAESNVQTVVDDLNKATIALLASQRVREQALAAEALNKDIDSSALKPLGVTAQRLDINQGTTVNTSVFLDSTGNLGLGDIALKGGEDLFVNAAGNISQVGQTVVKADGLNRGFMSIKAGGSISDAGPNTAGQFLADDLIMVAGAGVGAGDAVDIQAENLSVTGGSGGVNVANTTASVNGSPRYAALNITTVAGQSGINGDGDITLATDGDMNLVSLINDTNLSTKHTVTLSSSNGSLIDKNLSDINVQANKLVASAKNDINLDTDIDELSSSTHSTGIGSITIDEKSSLTIQSASAGNGDVIVTAGGDITVESILAQDSSTTDTTGVPAMPRLVGHVVLTASTGSIRDDGVDTTRIVAKTLTLNAAKDVGGDISQATAVRSLDTTVDEYTVVAKGVVNITESDDVKVKSVVTTGDVTLQSATGSLNIGKVETSAGGTTPTTVTLFATQGGVTDDLAEEVNVSPELTNITADRLAVKAKTGIGSSDDLDVKLDVLESETETGNIKLSDQTGDLAISDVTPGLDLPALNGVRVTTSGNVSLNVEAGSLDQQRELSTASGDIELTAKNAITIGSVLRTLLGKIGVTATTGAITTGAMAPISATQDVTLLADTDIVIDDTIATTEGNVSLTATKGSITLNDNLSTNSDAVRGMDGKFAAGNVMLSAKTDVTQNADILVKNGDVSVTATEGNLKMTTGKKTDITTAGNIVYSAGKQLDSEILATKLGDITLTAGTDLLANNTITTQGGAVKLTATTGKIDTDIDAAISATKDVTLLADTNIVIDDTIATTEGNVSLTATKGSITLNDNLSTNSTATRDATSGKFAAGNVMVSAKTDVTQNADILVKNGDVSVTATEGNLKMTTGKKTDITTAGNIVYSAGKQLDSEILATKLGDITLTAGTDLLANNTITTQGGAVKLTATTGKIDTDIDAAISATKDVTLLADTDIVIDDTIATTEGNVSLTATKGSITLNDNLSTNSDAVRGMDGKFAAGNVMLSAKTDVTQNADILVKNGDVSVTATEGNLKMTTGKKTDITSAGNIVYSAGKQLDSEILATKLGDITLTAGTDLLANNTITTQGGAVKLTATTGKIDTDIDAAISATKDVTLTADTNITVGDAVSTTAGDIALKTTKGFVTLNDTLTTNATAARVDGTFADGNITIDAATSITQNADITLNKGDLTLTANAGDLLQNANSKLNEGNALLTAKATTGANPTGGNISMRDAVAAMGMEAAKPATRIDVTSGNVTLSAATDINSQVLATDAGDVTLNAGKAIAAGQTITTKSGNVSLTATTDAITTDIDAAISATKDVTLTADTNITVGDAVSTTAGDIALKTTKGFVTLNDTLTTNATAARVDGTFADGNITIDAATSITQNADITLNKGDLTLTANAGDLLQNANSKLNEGNALLTAKATTGANPTGGNITMRDAGANNSPAATRIDVTSGNVTLAADNNINVAALSVADANAVTLTAANGAITGQTNTALHVQAGTLNATAKTGIGNALRTSLNKLIAKVTGTGNINIDEANEIELTQVSTNSGNFTLKAGDDVLARDVAIKGTATIDVNGALMTATGTSLGQIVATDLTVTALDSVNIRTNVDTADVVLSMPGSIVIDEANAIALNRLSTNNGNITATSAGTMAVKRVVAGGTSTASLTTTGANIVQAVGSTAPAVTANNTVLSANSGIGSQTTSPSSPLTLKTSTLKATSISGDIVLAQSGALSLDQVATSGNVNLAITGGGLTGDAGKPNLLKANEVKITAQDAVSVNTDAGSLLDIVTTIGDIVVTEVNGVSRLNLQAANVNATSTTGNLGIGSIKATNVVTLNATAGAILDADNDDLGSRTTNITAVTLNATAVQGIGRPGQALETAVGTLNAATQAGGVFFNNPGSFTVGTVTAAGGGIALQTGGTLTQTGPVSTSGNGDITVSGQNVTMALGSSTQTGSGTINYSAQNAVTITSLVSNTGLGGGAITVKAPTVNTVTTGRPNITGWIIDVSGDNVDLPRIQLLIGEEGLQSALIKQGFQVVGGTLANSRQFMEQILMPLQVEGNLPVNGALSRGLSPVSAPQLNTYNGFTEQLNGEWIFRL